MMIWKFMRIKCRQKLIPPQESVVIFQIPKHYLEKEPKKYLKNHTKFSAMELTYLAQLYDFSKHSHSKHKEWWKQEINFVICRSFL